jgi:hypothetical protein
MRYCRCILQSLQVFEPVFPVPSGFSWIVSYRLVSFGSPSTVPPGGSNLSNINP